MQERERAGMVAYGIRLPLALKARIEAAARADHFSTPSEWIRVRLAEAAEAALAHAEAVRAAS